jgi:hypothetical protein
MTAIRAMMGIGMLLTSACAHVAEPLGTCPIQGEVIHWVADYCMFRLATDDEIAAGDCIADEIKASARNECAAKTHYKRALCELVTKRDARQDSIEKCMADKSFMRSTVRAGGIGGTGQGR